MFFHRLNQWIFTIMTDLYNEANETIQNTNGTYAYDKLYRT